MGEGGGEGEGEGEAPAMRSGMRGREAVGWLRKAAAQGHAQAQQAMMDLGLELHTPDAQGGAE